MNNIRLIYIHMLKTILSERSIMIMHKKRLLGINCIKYGIPEVCLVDRIPSSASAYKKTQIAVDRLCSIIIIIIIIIIL